MIIKILETRDTCILLNLDQYIQIKKFGEDIQIDFARDRHIFKTNDPNYPIVLMFYNEKLGEVI